jgi:hypothetical protein
VHFGHQKVDLYTILDVYEGLRLSNGYINRNLHMMQDLFCLPEATLLADVCISLLLALRLKKALMRDLSPRWEEGTRTHHD